MMRNKPLQEYVESRCLHSVPMSHLRNAVHYNPACEDEAVTSTIQYLEQQNENLLELLTTAHERLTPAPIIFTGYAPPVRKEPRNKIIRLFVLSNGRSKHFGVTRLCHNWDWRVDLYFWSWTIWLEEIEEAA